MTFRCTKHSRIYNSKVSFHIRIVSDLNQLCFCSKRKSIFLRQNKDRPAHGKSGVKGVGYYGSVLRMHTGCTDNTLLHSTSGIEKLFAVFQKVELPICRKPVLFGKVIPSRGKNLCVGMRSKRAAPHTVNCALRC